MKNTLICDLDGTLALDDHRRPLIQSHGWKAYFDACVDDVLNEPVLHMLIAWRRCVAQETGVAGKLVILTGRCESQRKATESWLGQHGVYADHLLMRPGDSYDPLAKGEHDGHWTRDEDVKLAMIQELGLSPANVICCLDDRDRMVKFWRELGFDCWQVRPGAF